MVEPFAKARPRIIKRRGRTIAFMPQTYQDRRAELKKRFGPTVCGNLIGLRVLAYRKIPKSWSKKKKAEHRGIPCTTKPDLDNIIGAVMDALMDDDSNVVSLSGEKRWSDREDGAGYLDIEFYEIE